MLDEIFCCGWKFKVGGRPLLGKVSLVEEEEIQPYIM